MRHAIVEPEPNVTITIPRSLALFCHSILDEALHGAGPRNDNVVLACKICDRRGRDIVVHGEPV